MKNGKNQTKIKTMRTLQTPRTKRTPAVPRNLGMRIHLLALHTGLIFKLFKFKISCVMSCVTVIIWLDDQSIQIQYYRRIIPASGRTYWK